MSEQPLSPQGYNIKDRPVNANPFWETSPAEELGGVTAEANTLEAGDPATATVESVNNPSTGKTDLRFLFGIPEGIEGPVGAAGRPGEAGEPGRGIGVVAAETNAGSGVGVHVREVENVQNNEVDLTFHFDFPTEGSGSQSLEFTLLGTYLEEDQPPDDLVSRMREYPVVGFGVSYRGGDNVPSHDIQTLILTSDLTSMPDIHLCKACPAKHRCIAFLLVTVRSNGTKIIYYNKVKYMAPLIPITINGKPYYVNATAEGDPYAQKYFGLCVWGVRLKEGFTHE